MGGKESTISSHWWSSGGLLVFNSLPVDQYSTGHSLCGLEHYKVGHPNWVVVLTGYVCTSV